MAHCVTRLNVIARAKLRNVPIRTLVSTQQDAGWYEVAWNSTNSHGNPVSAGTYFARLQAGSYTKVIKMTHLR